MDLRHRPTTCEDLEPCLRIIRNGFAFHEADRRNLIALWHHLLGGNMAESAVIEDQARPPGQRIVGFGMSVFVTDEFAREAQTVLTPYLAKHVLCRWLEGRPPFLNALKIRQANSTTGLRGLILHNGWEVPETTDGDVSAIRRAIMESFFVHHRGYRLRSFLHEIYGESERDKMEVLGWHRENDYVTFTTDAHPPSPPESHPFLMSLQSEDARDNAFFPFYPLFRTPPPCLFFRPAEQALLRLALRGENDSEIAGALHVSLSTIHKRWRAIYEIVMERGTGLCLLPTSSGSGRGQEKRRLLLRYLQDHPEELRPIIAPGRGGTATPGAPTPRRHGSKRS